MLSPVYKKGCQSGKSTVSYPVYRKFLKDGYVNYGHIVC